MTTPTATPPASVLVTGATGTVGAEVVRCLQAAGHPVRIAVRTPPSALDAAPGEPLPSPAPAPARSSVRFDFTAAATWRPAFAGIERLFLVRPPALGNVERDIFPALAVAESMGVRQVVFLSLLGAERLPFVPHRRLERRLAASGMAYTFLRSSFFMQNLSTTHRQEIRDDDVIAVPAGQGRTSFIDARDVAAVAARALTAPPADPTFVNRAYDLTGSEALTYAEVAALLSDALGRRIAYTDPSLWAFARRMRRLGHPLGFVLVTAAIYTTARLGLAARVTADTSELLGRPPRSLPQFITDYAPVWRR